MPGREHEIPTRERILLASAELFRRQGYAGTGLKEITSASEAPFGSVYHHFPGGKAQLAEEVLRVGGRFFLALYEEIADRAPDYVSGIAEFFDGAGQTLLVTDFADACPIATVAAEVASSDEALRVVCAEAFESWIEAARKRFVADGGDPAESRSHALAVLCLLEGAFLFGRTLRSVEPMQAAGAAAVGLAQAALGATRGGDG